MFPIGLRAFRDQKVTSMFAIDLLGCAVAPVLFWVAMSRFGIPSVVGASALAYGALATVFLSRKP